MGLQNHANIPPLREPKKRMPKFIRVERSSGAISYINVDQVISFEPNAKGGSIIMFAGGKRNIGVVEEPGKLAAAANSDMEPQRPRST
jgi:hypothetical protein